MQVDISKAGLVTLMGSPLTTISTVKQGFKVTTNNGYLLFASIMDLCRDLGIRPEALRVAVEAEGYEIDGHDIRPLAKNAESERPAVRRVERTSEGAFDRVPSLVQSEPVEGDQPQEHPLDRIPSFVRTEQASDLETIAMDLARLVADKQRQYGDSAGRSGAILRILYPEGVKPDQYDRMLLVVRVLDKLSRLATNKVDLGGESPWRDIMGYALLAVEKGF